MGASRSSAAAPTRRRYVVVPAALAVVVLGPPIQGPELPKLSAAWAPDASTVRAPPPSFNAPHRPPIT